MKTDNWKKLENIFHTALELPFGERKPFLQRECAGDGKLISEVESLIESFENEADFLDTPVFELGLGAIHESTKKNPTGTTLGFYEVQEKIGAGGMGEVYKALDTRLNRPVALKFLSEALANDNAAKRQFVKEAQAAAALSHPNICTVHGIEQTDEYHFIVMQYVEGETLAESFEKQTVATAQFKSLARQIATAVAFAHSHGILHRDLKPGNIMLEPDGQIKILDFGLAKVIAQNHLTENADDISRFSTNGLIIGTVTFMSPEQLRGEKLDFRSDIFSIGIILYQLLTNQNPFSRSSQAETIAAILSEQPAPLAELAPEVPKNLTNLVEKCLQKDKQARFQSVAEILVELDNAEIGSNSARNSKHRGGFFLKAVFAAALLLAALATMFFYKTNRPQRTLAVLPISIETTAADKEYLADGLTQNIIEKMSNLSDLKVKNESVINRYKGKTVEPQMVGKELNVDAVLVGTIQKRDVNLVLTTKLVRTSDGFVMDSSESEIDEANLTELPKNISLLIAGKINLNLTEEDKTNLAKKETSNEEAKKLYFLGRYYLSRRSRGDEKNAVINFQTAKELDPYYAKAWAGLADAYLAQSSPGVEDSISPKEAVDLARVATKKALEIDSNLSEAYNSLGLINSKYDWNWVQAEANFRASIRRNPEFIPARTGLIAVLNALGKFDESLEEARKIKEIDPVSTTGDLETAKIYYMKYDFQQMENIINDVLSRNPGNVRISYIQTYLFLNTGRFNEAISFLETLYKSEKPSDKIFAAGPLGFAYAKAGRRDDALKVIETLDELAKKQYVAPQEKAFVYIGLGNFDKAFEYLTKSCDERFYSLAFWVIDPIVDEIKSDARFRKIKACVNL